MLKQRVITAIVLLAILLPALFYPSPLPFCLLALLLIAAGAWEWGKLNGCSQIERAKFRICWNAQGYVAAVHVFVLHAKTLTAE